MGDYLTHRFNPELGVGRVATVEGRAVAVEFPKTGTSLRLASTTDALLPVDLSAGRPVRVTGTREDTTIGSVISPGVFRLANGQDATSHELWPLDMEGALLERLAIGDVDGGRDFLARLDLLRLLTLREAHGLGTFLGGRIRLFPHQLYVAEQASTADPVRWLLADEVGLGKTIEAALILNRLVHTKRVDRCLIVAPDTLTVQWLGELWRKYHQVFTLLDGPRLADVARDFGADFNPFDVHRRAVVSLEMLVERPELTAQAVRAGIDLLVVDEAQRLRRPAGHPGDLSYRAVAPIAALGRHVLLLSATPLQDDAHGFLRLLQLLRPDDFPDDQNIQATLAEGSPLPPCTSSTRRRDIGGLPPRVGVPVALDGAGSAARAALEQAVRSEKATTALARRQKLERVRRAVASGAALKALLKAEDGDLVQQAMDADATDPRVRWLVEECAAWRDAGQKTLVFVEHHETLDMLRTALSHQGQLATAVFHAGLSAARRDTEVARFREAEGPSLLISTEAGGEGRNFEFCQRLVLFDMPWTPSVVEQRIGRLDRIGRRIPVEVVYFRPPGGIGGDVVRLYEALGIFVEPLAGLEHQTAPAEDAIEAVALKATGALTDARLVEVIAAVRGTRDPGRESAYQALHRAPYRGDMAAGLLSRVPPELDAMNERVVVTACSRLGFSIERTKGRRGYAIELGSEATVDSLPGVPGGSAFVGSFDREEAVDDETLDYFASGHPLVEGVFAHFEDSPRGRVARLAVDFGGERGEGLVAIYRDGPTFEVIAIDAHGRRRPDWATALRRAQARVRTLKPERGGVDERRAASIRRMGALLDATRRPYALASLDVRPLPPPDASHPPR